MLASDGMLDCAESSPGTRLYFMTRKKCISFRGRIHVSPMNMHVVRSG